MDIKPQKIEFEDGTKGEISISPNFLPNEILKSWIIEKRFNEYTDEKYRMDRHTRKRNKLYEFVHPLTNSNVILKVSTIDKQYNFLRRINLLLSTLFSDYNFRAFKGGLELKKIGVSCQNPIAYWTESNFFFNKNSYYLYEKIEANHSLYSFIESLSPADKNKNNDLYLLLAKKTIDIIKQIHNAGFRQGDPHPGNFLVSLPKQKYAAISIDDVNNMDMFIIDLDKFSIAKPLGPFLKRFFDLRCMRRCTLGPYNQEEMLKFYLQEEYSTIWKGALYFWIRGGFNPVKWFRTPKRGQ